MKTLYFLPLLLVFSTEACAQNLQLHYDFRYTFDPKLNPGNFPVLSFEYFRNIDTVGTGSFLFKVQADFRGEQHAIGQVFTQVSQTLKFWRPPVYISLNFSGGLGVAGASFGYHVPNSYGIGIACPFQWKGAWLSAAVVYRYNAFNKPSHDTQATFYFGKGLFNYRIFIAGSFVAWSENRDRGIEFTKNQVGKKIAMFGDPQIWIKVTNALSLGSRINVFYHTLSDDEHIQIYPTVGAKYQFE